MTSSSIASPKSSGKRDMWAPFWSASRSTKHSISAATSASWPRVLHAHRLLHAGHADAGEAEPHLGRGGLQIGRSQYSLGHRGNRSTLQMSPDEQFPRLVGIACHDLRTPLATVHGFARTLQRTPLGEPADRYVEMIDAASLQIAELLEELALVARIELGRYEPHARGRGLARAGGRGGGRAARGPGERHRHGRARFASRSRPTRRAVRQLARAARRHGGRGVDVGSSSPGRSSRSRRSPAPRRASSPARTSASSARPRPSG